MRIGIPKTISPERAARIIFGSKDKKRSVIKLIRAGKLGGFQVYGGGYRTTVDWVKEYIKSQRIPDERQQQAEAVNERRKNKKVVSLSGKSFKEAAAELEAKYSKRA